MHSCVGIKLDIFNMGVDRKLPSDTSLHQKVTNVLPGLCQIGKWEVGVWVQLMLPLLKWTEKSTLLKKTNSENRWRKCLKDVINPNELSLLYPACTVKSTYVVSAYNFFNSLSHVRDAFISVSLVRVLIPTISGDTLTPTAFQSRRFIDNWGQQLCSSCLFFFVYSFIFWNFKF